MFIPFLFKPLKDEPTVEQRLSESLMYMTKRFQDEHDITKKAVTERDEIFREALNIIGKRSPEDAQNFYQKFSLPPSN